MSFPTFRRKAAAHQKRRIVYNDDGVYVRPFDTPEKFVKTRLQQAINSQVDTVMFNVGTTTNFTFDTDIGETYGEFINDQSAPFAKNLKWALRD